MQFARKGGHIFGSLQQIALPAGALLRAFCNQSAVQAVQLLRKGNLLQFHFRLFFTITLLHIMKRVILFRFQIQLVRNHL